MPELPEVEVVKNGMRDLFGEGSVIEKISCLRKDLREVFPLNDFKKLKGARVLNVHRRAKYLIIETDRGNLLSHLGMTGTWRLCPEGAELLHDHVYIYLKDGRRLAYRDPRRFGYLGYFDVGAEHAKLRSLGPEPLEAEFTAKKLIANLIGKKMAIKALIMDQRVVVGVGNIYASEALFFAGIDPLKPAEKIDIEAARRLVKEIKKILKSSIQKGGSSISDFASTAGEKGYFQNDFQVYDREGELCYNCDKERIIKAVVAGRSTFWCSRCQK